MKYSNPPNGLHYCCCWASGDCQFTVCQSHLSITFETPRRKVCFGSSFMNKVFCKTICGRWPHITYSEKCPDIWLKMVKVTVIRTILSKPWSTIVYDGSVFLLKLQYCNLPNAIVLPKIADIVLFAGQFY